MSSLASSLRAHAALESNLWSTWSQFGRASGCSLHDRGGALWFETPIEVPPYNMVLRFHGDADADETIESIFQNFSRRGVPFLWLVHPSARPIDLTARLKSRGFDEVELITGMGADLNDLPPVPVTPSNVQIHEVTPTHSFAPLMELVATRWNLPEIARTNLLSMAREVFRIGEPESPNRAWIAIKDGVAVAKVVTHDTADAGGSVGVYGVATTPEARGLGLGRLLCIKALTAARERGHDLAVLHSTPMAISLYRGMGFSDLASFHIYAAPQSFHA